MEQRSPYIVTGEICPECHEPPSFLHAGYCSKAKGNGVERLVQGKRIGNWMMTYTGRAFYPYDIRDGDIDIEDIGHALSMLCRYGGHSKRFYSVAEHSVLVSKMVPRAHMFAGLMHDATEAYLVDMPRPIKIGFPQYKEMEGKLWVAIADRFGLAVEHPAEVDRADGEVLWHEMAALLKPVPVGHEWGMGRPKPAELHPEWISGWPPELAKYKFMERFKELTA